MAYQSPESKVTGLLVRARSWFKALKQLRGPKLIFLTPVATV